MTKSGKLFKKAITSGEVDYSVKLLKQAVAEIEDLPVWWVRDEVEDRHDTFMDGMLQGYLAGLKAKKEVLG